MLTIGEGYSSHTIIKSKPWWVKSSMQLVHIYKQMAAARLVAHNECIDFYGKQIVHIKIKAKL